MNEISKKIYDLMKKKDISYGDLATNTGIPKSALQRYATGATEKIPMDRVELIAKALRTSPEYLLGWDEEPQTETYYLNEDTAQLAQEIYDNEKLGILLDASRKLKPEDLEYVVNLVTRLKGEE